MPDYNNKFDNIIIGSSPVALVESIHLARSGKNVLLLEKNSRLGGAWGSYDFSSYKNIEFGPHTIKSRPGLYKLLKDLGIKLIPMRPLPLRQLDRSFLGFHFIPWNWRWFELNRSAIHNTTILYKSYLYICFFLRIIKNISGKFFYTARFEILYIEGGTQQMVNHLFRLAELAGVKVKMNTSALEIDVDTKSSKVEIKTKKCTYFATELIYTSGTQLDSIRIDKTSVKFDDEPQVHNELLLVIDDIKAVNFSFIKSCDSDPIIHMFQNITPQIVFDNNSNNNNNNINILVFRLRDGVTMNEKTIDSILEKLKRFNLITQNAYVIDFKWVIYSIPFRRQERIDELNGIAMPFIRGMYTYDLGVSMLNNAERWTDTLNWIQDNHPFAGITAKN